AIGAAEGLIRILSTPLPQQPANGRDLPPRRAMEIRFEDVSFHHPADLPLNDEGEALGPIADRGGLGVEEISLTLARGGCVALVGPSGAGKTTLTQLLLRFIVPQQGRIRVNGLDLAMLPEEVWMARIGWMPQRPTLFYGTILDN
ncbi:ATP-binding cassette domain-containing protein, partial [Thioclava sp. BHET1]